MLNKTTQFTPTSKNKSLPSIATEFSPLWDSLKAHGYCLLRNYEMDMSAFSELVGRMCTNVTLDPARANSATAIQKVDAGTDALGLHIENGNTPNAPELVFFYCKKAPKHGSQTTLCDGTLMLQSLSTDERQKFEQTLYVSRTITEHHWKTYLANEHPLLDSSDDVSSNHLVEMMASRSDIEGILNEDMSLSYRLAINPILEANLCKQKAFANAILGPSFSYEKPVYEFEDGSLINETQKLNLASIAENHTIEIPWQDGDLAIIDNHRVMHGRREITDTSSRELYIGMGNI